MKYKLIDSSFNEKNGISYVKIKTKLGIFEGTAKRHPKDIDIQSNFFGCKLAELRAIKKFFLKNKKEIKNKQLFLENLISNLQLLKNYNHNNTETRFIRKQYFILQKELQKIDKEILYLDIQIKTLSNNYRETLDTVYKKIEENRRKRDNGEKE